MTGYIETFVFLALFASYVHSSAFTFEIPNGEFRCFYNGLTAKKRSQIEFQVISGGNFDVDVTMRDPKNEIVKTFKREQYNYFEYEPQMNGDYQVGLATRFCSTTSFFCTTDHHEFFSAPFERHRSLHRLCYLGRFHPFFILTLAVGSHSFYKCSHPIASLILSVRILLFYSCYRFIPIITFLATLIPSFLIMIALLINSVGYLTKASVDLREKVLRLFQGNIDLFRNA
uniref:Transmembrane emp24 domain-containing protein 7 n=1 Tax=Schistocephalus solidus TaxID=70667 RepID=A0A0X3NV84_SCHSO